jgi:hypothetical protein
VAKQPSTKGLVVSLAIKLVSIPALLIGLAAGAISGSQAMAATHFFEATTYGQGQARDMVVRDFDGDGHEDIVSVAEGKVSVWLGDGAGDFEIVDRSTGKGIPGDVQVGDMNGDQVLDVVTTDVQSHETLILDGLGDGQLAEPRVIAENYWGTVVLGDFGGDSALDIAASRWDNKTVVLVQGAGGGFSPTVELPVSVGDGSVVRDLDEDGDADLAQLSSNDEVLVFRQGPSGIFGAPSVNPVDDSPSDLEVVDLDSDGHLDLVTSSIQHGGTISVVHGQGGGSFQPVIIHPAGSAISALETADLDGDDDVDLALPGYDGFARAMLQDENGDFDLVDSGILYASVMGAGSGLADFDEDGQDDLVLMVPSHAGIQVAFGDALHVNTPWIDFGSMWASTAHTESFAVRNTGSSPVSPGAIELLEGSDAFAVVDNECAGRMLGLRESCSVGIRFTAPLVDDAFGAVFSIAGSPATGPRFVLAEGSSFIPASLTINPADIDFGFVRAGGTSPVRSAQVTNTGSSPVSIDAASASQGFEIRADACAGQELDPGQSCAVSVVFKPTATTPLTGSLTVTFFGGTTPASAALRGSRTASTVPRTPRSTPLPSSTPDFTSVERDLGRLVTTLPRLLRGGPTRILKLPAFTARFDGVLRLRLGVVRGGKQLALAHAWTRVAAGRAHRLSFRLVGDARRLLRRPQATRVKAVVTFQPKISGRVLQRSTRLLVEKAPAKKRKRR